MDGMNKTRPNRHRRRLVWFQHIKLKIQSRLCLWLLLPCATLISSRISPSLTFSHSHSDSFSLRPLFYFSSFLLFCSSALPSVVPTLLKSSLFRCACPPVLRRQSMNMHPLHPACSWLLYYEKDQREKKLVESRKSRVWQLLGSIQLYAKGLEGKRSKKRVCNVAEREGDIDYPFNPSWASSGPVPRRPLCPAAPSASSAPHSPASAVHGPSTGSRVHPPPPAFPAPCWSAQS